MPELLEVRGRELVERIAGQLTERLGDAELLWSRVSREPYATIALRPGRRAPRRRDERADVVRAGTWTDTGWPATMESAVRSGRAAAQHLLSTAACDESTGMTVDRGADAPSTARSTAARAACSSCSGPTAIWVGELESNVTMTAQHLFWNHYLGLRTPRPRPAASRTS